jgi:hypothetical protein
MLMPFLPLRDVRAPSNSKRLALYKATQATTFRHRVLGETTNVI